MAVECHYRVGEIDAIPFRSALQLADYWAMEPPFTYLYYRAHFKVDEEQHTAEGSIQPNLPANHYDTLAAPLQANVRKVWLKRNPGKTEADFFKALRGKKKEEYAAKLEELRKNRK